MRWKTFFWLIIVALCLAPLACSDSGGHASRDIVDAGVDTPGDGSDAPADVNAGSDAGIDASDACVALTCEDFNPSCGTHDNGCGGQIRCGECTCSPATVNQDCPPGPCVEAVGCTDRGTCDYQPITCGGQSCGRCAAETCAPDDIRVCGDPGSCPAAQCDPAPLSSAGGVTYQNICSDQVQISCGTCNLGSYQCDADGGFSCHDIELPAAPNLRANCRGTTRPTFVYVDPSYTGDNPTGTRQAPFTTIGAALHGARMVDATALVIGGSGEMTLPAQSADGRPEAPNYGFRIPNGISLFGGYTGAPDFLRDLSQRPTVYAAHSNIALEAHGVDLPTRVSHLHFENSRDELQGTSYGAVIADSPALQLIDVKITANSPPRAHDPNTVAVPMPASTHHVAPSGTANFNASGAERWCNQSSDLMADSPTPLRCPIFDAGARTFYQSPTVPANLTEEGTGGRGGTSTWGTPQAGSPGGDPLGAGDEASGGMQAKGGDAQAYTGAQQFSAPGAAGLAGGEIAGDGLWHEHTDGDFGAIGHPGRSGGGGGSHADRALFIFDSNPFQFICIEGPTGANGGSGGCGGLGGRGGAGGDWAIGMMIDDPSQTTFENIRLVVADAGDGQIGSAGGEGAAGAQGESSQEFHYYDPRGPNPGDSTTSSYAGGDGAKGQWGGHGGNGAGGSTVGILCANATLQDLSPFHIDLGQPGEGASGSDPNAPSGMPLPTSPGPDGQQYPSYNCGL